MNIQRSGILLGVAAVYLAGCSGWNDAQIVTVDGFSMAMKTRPAPPEVGQKALINVKLTRGEKGPAGDCSVVFRQLMPGMEMSTDHVETTMLSEGNGIYSATSGEFSMGGDWQIEVKFTCGDAERTAAFAYHLEWQE